MKFSVIGCQHVHIEIFIEEMLKLGHECAGIFELENMTLASSLAEKYNIPLVHDKMLLLDDAIQIVGCAGINNEKIDVIELCEKYRKHVMLDKPAVTNREDLARLKTVMKRGFIQVGMLLTERFRPSLSTLKKQLNEGVIGDLVSISMRKPHLLKQEERPLWHFSKQQSGGIVNDLFIHDFDLLRWLTGKEVRSITGYMAKNILSEYPSFFDTAGFQVIMEGGLAAQLYADWFTPEKSWTWGDGRIFVVGTKGTIEIRLEGDPLVSKDALYLQVTSQQELTAIEESSIPITITEDFLNRIHGQNSLLQHVDIIAATEATIRADECAEIIYRIKEKS
ncbi:Gfo/Idh/MocA family oxidoreductase [Bacillus sp. APMAM]|nr:Gfo/Idh/MocA family oxidoreductase [Bacillus sp. APMAM]RTZ56346.1 Gfo/Idh/MocA family oxidoreductase [Bacillus sp. SAJ1]